MKKKHFINLHRKKHFDFFRNFDQPHFNICANVNITRLLKAVKKEKLSLNTTMVYCVSRTANAIAEFRQRIREDYVIEHEAVHPSFSVSTDVSDVFSFCPVDYQESFSNFYQSATEMIKQMKKNPLFEDEQRDDYLFLSSIPWVSFTGVVHAMNLSPADSVPRITWGKFFEENGKVKMPLSVQAHHALVDGRHVGLYYEEIQALFEKVEDWVEY